MVRDHLFSTYAKFSEKLTFLIPWYAHVRTWKFAYVLNEWSLNFLVIFYSLHIGLSNVKEYKEPVTSAWNTTGARSHIVVKYLNNVRRIPKVLCKKGVLKNFAKFTGKHLWKLKSDSGTGVFSAFSSTAIFTI